MKQHLKTSLAVALLSCVIGSGSMAHAAADSQEINIELKATIPSDEFHVLPIDSGWITKTQEMEFDATQKKLKPFIKRFQFKNTAGAISASLVSGELNTQQKPFLSDGTNELPLKVTFNNKELTDTTVEVATKDQAAKSGTASLVITQDAISKVSGTFTGRVGIIFEPATP